VEEKRERKADAGEKAEEVEEREGEGGSGPVMATGAEGEETTRWWLKRACREASGGSGDSVAPAAVKDNPSIPRLDGGALPGMRMDAARRTPASLPSASASDVSAEPDPSYDLERSYVCSLEKKDGCAVFASI
jgi:hypothetical protein